VQGPDVLFFVVRWNHDAESRRTRGFSPSRICHTGT
jgi:hypothetical protein